MRKTKKKSKEQRKRAQIRKRSRANMECGVCEHPLWDLETATRVREPDLGDRFICRACGAHIEIKTCENPECECLVTYFTGMSRMRCADCGHDWDHDIAHASPRKDVQCEACDRVIVPRALKVCVCLDCGFEWRIDDYATRFEGRPCPQCKSRASANADDTPPGELPDRIEWQD